MADNVSTWTFTQISGDEHTLVLADHYAPHGRERKKPVVEDESELREDTVYYAGNNVPTHHIFGTKEANQVLEGRLSDSYGGQGFARKKRTEMKAFFLETQPCRVVWDDLVATIAIIKAIKFGIESGGSIPYRLELLISQDQFNSDFSQFVPEPKGPQDFTAQIQAAMLDKDKLAKVPGLKGSIFDSISSLISSVAAATSELNTIAGQIDSFANAPFQLLNQLRAACDQFRTAVTALRQTYDDLTVHIALERQNSSDWQNFWDVQSAWTVSSLDAIRQAIAMDRAAATAQQDSIKEIYTAQVGDTWDGISRSAFSGSADRAADIRAANGIADGSNPVPGTSYMVPV